ncbi:MAG: hypothetical protein GF332_03070 [Candidatus Moranbacteria bacterium]|nr:hypothetical protein [Candidatus Moranbacteria bacterium]
MQEEYEQIKAFLPKNNQAILEIGCGMAGIDLMLFHHYKRQGKLLKIYLLDKTRLDRKIYYNYKPKTAFYNSLRLAKKFLIANQVPAKMIFTQEVKASKILFETKFDLIISLGDFTIR